MGALRGGIERTGFQIINTSGLAPKRHVIERVLAREQPSPTKSARALAGRPLAECSKAGEVND